MNEKDRLNREIELLKEIKHLKEDQLITTIAALIVRIRDSKEKSVGEAIKNAFPLSGDDLAKQVQANVDFDMNKNPRRLSKGERLQLLNAISPE